MAYVTQMRSTLVFSPDAIRKVMWAVKVCSNKILQIITEHRMVGLKQLCVCSKYDVIPYNL